MFGIGGRVFLHLGCICKCPRLYETDLLALAQMGGTLCHSHVSYKTLPDIFGASYALMYEQVLLLSIGMSGLARGFSMALSNPLQVTANLFDWVSLNDHVSFAHVITGRA